MSYPCDPFEMASRPAVTRWDRELIYAHDEICRYEREQALRGIVSLMRIHEIDLGELEPLLQDD